MLFRNKITSIALVAGLAMASGLAVGLPAQASTLEATHAATIARSCLTDSEKLDTLAAYSDRSLVLFDSIVLHGVHPECINNVSVYAIQIDGKKKTLASGLSFLKKRKVNSVYKVQLDLAFDMYKAKYLFTNKPNCAPMTTRSIVMTYFYGAQKRTVMVSDSVQSICPKAIRVNYKYI